MLQVFSCYVQKSFCWQDPAGALHCKAWVEVTDFAGDLWVHKHHFYGPEGHAEAEAKKLCERVKKARQFDPQYWHFYGNEYADESAELAA